MPKPELDRAAYAAADQQRTPPPQLRRHPCRLHLQQLLQKQQRSLDTPIRHDRQTTTRHRINTPSNKRNNNRIPRARTDLTHIRSHTHLSMVHIRNRRLSNSKQHRQTYQQQQQQAYQQQQLYAQQYTQQYAQQNAHQNAHQYALSAASAGYASPFGSVSPPPTYPRTPETTPHKPGASVLSRPKKTAVGRATLTNMTDCRNSGQMGSGLTDQNAAQSLAVLPKSSMNSVQPAALVRHR